MAIKNFWSLEPGEAIFAEELHKKFKDKINVYFPLKDTGIDLLAVSRSSNKTVSFQVKESRYYEDKNTSWHQETKEKIQNNKNKVDFYVFLIYLPGHMAGTKKKSLFEKLFIIIPTRDLIERVKIKKTVKSGKYKDRKSTRLNSSHIPLYRMPSSA